MSDQTQARAELIRQLRVDYGYPGLKRLMHNAADAIASCPQCAEKDIAVVASRLSVLEADEATVNQARRATEFRLRAEAAECRVSELEQQIGAAKEWQRTIDKKYELNAPVRIVQTLAAHQALSEWAKDVTLDGGLEVMQARYQQAIARLEGRD